ncbi:Piso0_003149 [Millerozyma farinosa CBS 7064]|uniref:Piso0_003149 protein n=1 Tax=Pichia sorbitophila (strain ATCC MYA-4447 / BCRC 22081 / CBS 7064 / NBRC 10061 / NRRL Y-12695) TaxID=559304 RepID=G8YKH2_PICSO|nr:Piso0_003149 [Millerozyma farinosa CBS 7064]CCE80817.1 Piso0_003149 [Millerozyma farinosa CBS 7064]
MIVSFCQITIDRHQRLRGKYCEVHYVLTLILERKKSLKHTRLQMIHSGRMLKGILRHRPLGSYPENILGRRLYSKLTLPDNDVVRGKPKLGEFKTAFFHCFLIASTTYMVLHAIWTGLEYEEKEKSYLSEAGLLENRLQELVDEKKNKYKKTRWFSSWGLWR